MSRWPGWMLGACLVVFASRGAVAADAPPPRVLPISRHAPSRGELLKLRDEWRTWADAHPEDGHAWAQLAKVAGYCGASCAELAPLAEKAYRLAPDDASACIALAWQRWRTWCGTSESPDSAIALCEHAVAMDPEDVETARVRLWAMKLCKGDRPGAEAELSAMLDGGRIPEPLADYDWNELAGLEPDAILLTNGDDDTCPAVALQVARGFRTDVTVVNLNLLNLEAYRRALREGPHPLDVPVELQPATQDSSGQGTRAATESQRALRALVRTYVKPGSPRPVYLAVTVPMPAEQVGAKLSAEGLVDRLLPGRPEEVADTSRLERNLGSVYRMESATSPALDWDDWSALRAMAANYAAAEHQLAQALAGAGDRQGASRAMARALALCAFHHSESTSYFLDSWRRLDPRSPDLARWSRQLGK